MAESDAAGSAGANEVKGQVHCSRPSQVTRKGAEQGRGPARPSQVQSTCSRDPSSGSFVAGETADTCSLKGSHGGGDQSPGLSLKLPDGHVAHDASWMSSADSCSSATISMVSSPSSRSNGSSGKLESWGSCSASEAPPRGSCPLHGGTSGSPTAQFAVAASPCVGAGQPMLGPLKPGRLHSLQQRKSQRETLLRAEEAATLVRATSLDGSSGRRHESATGTAPEQCKEADARVAPDRTLGEAPAAVPPAASALRETQADGSQLAGAGSAPQTRKNKQPPGLPRRSKHPWPPPPLLVSARSLGSMGSQGGVAEVHGLGSAASLDPLDGRGEQPARGQQKDRKEAREAGAANTEKQRPKHRGLGMRLAPVEGAFSPADIVARWRSLQVAFSPTARNSGSKAPSISSETSSSPKPRSNPTTPRLSAANEAPDGHRTPSLPGQAGSVLGDLAPARREVRARRTRHPHTVNLGRLPKPGNSSLGASPAPALGYAADASSNALLHFQVAAAQGAKPKLEAVQEIALGSVVLPATPTGELREEVDISAVFARAREERRNGRPAGIILPLKASLSQDHELRSPCSLNKGKKEKKAKPKSMSSTPGGETDRARTSQKKPGKETAKSSKKQLTRSAEPKRARGEAGSTEDEVDPAPLPSPSPPMYPRLNGPATRAPLGVPGARVDVGGSPGLPAAVATPTQRLRTLSQRMHSSIPRAMLPSRAPKHAQQPSTDPATSRAQDRWTPSLASKGASPTQQGGVASAVRARPGELGTARGLQAVGNGVKGRLHLLRQGLSSPWDEGKTTGRTQSAEIEKWMHEAEGQSLREQDQASLDPSLVGLCQTDFSRLFSEAREERKQGRVAPILPTALRLHKPTGSTARGPAAEGD